jgi:Lipase maturation factor
MGPLREGVEPESPPAGDPGAAVVPTRAAAAALDGDFRLTARLFLRALGLVYLVAFASIAVQARLLVGSEGLLPVAEFLGPLQGLGVARFWRLPTLFWLWDGDVAVRWAAVVGMGLAIGLLLGWRAKACLVGSWLLFLSYVTVGRDFFSFQWDSLLLEASALALLLPASPATPPHPWLVFMFRWLLFRLLFESALAKVQQGGQSWFSLLAMAWYYETVPLPSIGSWYAHQLPLWMQRATSALTLLGELLAPLLIWGPRGARRAAFVLILGFQVLIQGTANYGYFNLLSAALTLFLLDARDLQWLSRWLGRRVEIPAIPRPVGRRPLVALAVAAIFLLSVLELMVLLAGGGVAASPPLVSVREAVIPFRLANRYHLFARIDPQRVEAEIEWTIDGERWRPYVMHYKPGPEERRPPIVAPHQPRVDFQLWFFTLGRDGGVHPYFDTLVRRLCTRPAAVAALFLPESMPPGVPAALRVAYYRYRMTDRLTLTRERRYWSRELLGYHPVAYFCDSTAPPRF